MKIAFSSIICNDQEKALKFYTEVLGFVKKADIPFGEFRWLTVVSPEDPNGTELVLEPDVNPAARTFTQALREQGIPLTAFTVKDIHKEYERMKALGVSFPKPPVEQGPVIMAMFEDTVGNLIHLAQPLMTAADLSSRREIAVEWLKLCATPNAKEAYDKYAAKNFKHHNAYFAGDAESLWKAQADNAAQFPEKKVEVLRTLEDGDLVTIHGRVRMNPQGPDIALVHIFRFEGDKIAELWDLGQVAPDVVVNKNGMF